MIDRFERFSFAIFEISRHWHKITADVMAEYGLKGPHAIYLIALKKSGGITAARLCALCDRDKADVSRAISLMEKQGLVRRDSKQSYRAQLELTEAGLAAAEHVWKKAQAAVDAVGRGIPEEEREKFYIALESIAVNLRELSTKGIPV